MKISYLFSLLNLIGVCIFVNGCTAAEVSLVSDRQVITAKNSEFPLELSMPLYSIEELVPYIPSNDFEEYKGKYLLSLLEKEPQHITVEALVDAKTSNNGNNTFSTGDWFIVDDDYIKSLYNYNEKLKTYGEEVMAFPYALKTTESITLQREGACYFFGEGEEKLHFRLQSLSDNIYLVSASKLCSNTDVESTAHTIFFIHISHGVVSLLPAQTKTDEIHEFDQWAKGLNRIQKYWYGASEINHAQDLELLLSDNSLAESIEKDGYNAWKANRFSAYKSYFKTMESAVIGEKTPIAMQSDMIERDTLVYEAHIALKSQKDELISLRRNEYLEKERVIKKQEAEREAKRVEELKKKNLAAEREAKSREDIFYFARLDDADLYLVTEMYMNKLSSIGEVSSGFLGMNTHATLNFKYVPISGDQNPTDLNANETHIYYKHLGGSRFETIKKVTATRTCRNSWVRTSNRINVTFDQNPDWTDNKVHSWRVSPIGRVCKYPGIDTSTCNFERCLEYRNKEHPAYIVHGRAEAEAAYKKTRRYVDTSRLGRLYDK